MQNRAGESHTILRAAQNPLFKKWWVLPIVQLASILFSLHANKSEASNAGSDSCCLSFSAGHDEFQDFKPAAQKRRGARGTALAEWRNWIMGRNKHGLIFILQLSAWHLFTPSGTLKIKSWFFTPQNMQGYFSPVLYTCSLTTEREKEAHGVG